MERNTCCPGLLGAAFEAIFIDAVDVALDFFAIHLDKVDVNESPGPIQAEIMPQHTGHRWPQRSAGRGLLTVMHLGERQVLGWYTLFVH